MSTSFDKHMPLSGSGSGVYEHVSSGADGAGGSGIYTGGGGLGINGDGDGVTTVPGGNGDGSIVTTGGTSGGGVGGGGGFGGGWHRAQLDMSSSRFQLYSNHPTTVATTTTMAIIYISLFVTVMQIKL